MSDVFSQVTMCKRNRRPRLLSVVSFGTACLGLLFEAQDPFMNASQKRDFKFLNSTVTERNLLFLRLERGSDKLKTIYHFFVVTLVMALAPACQAGW